MNQLLDLILSLIYPPKCPFCGRVLERSEEGMCFACQRTLPWVEEGKVRTMEFCGACLAPLWYRDRVRDGMHRYKFQHGRAHARLFGTLMAQCLQDRWREPVDLITWAPLSRKRLRERGYDQAELLARRVGEVTGLPVTAALVKTRNTKAQSGLDADDSRKANVQGVYACRPGVDLAGKRVILVDDVATSGSTLAECAACLRKAGAVSVVALTLARAR